MSSEPATPMSYDVAPHLRNSFKYPIVFVSSIIPNLLFPSSETVGIMVAFSTSIIL